MCADKSSTRNGVSAISRLSPTPTPIVARSIFSHVRWEYLVAGVSGGVVSTLLLHPLDLIKIRFQVNEGYGVAVHERPEYRGVIHALKSIRETTGVTGLYQGVTPNVWGAGLSWGLYFFFYNSLKTYVQDGDTKKALGPSSHLGVASGAGLVTLVLTNPIWVTKTRLCLQYDNEKRVAGLASKPVVHYNGTMDALSKIYRMEGIRGLYKGFTPGLLGISHGAVQFMTYEEMKNYYNQRRGCAVDTRLSTMEYLSFAAMSKIIAATLTYPYQVLRARLQDQHRSYKGVIDVTQQIIKYEGARGLYKGLSVYLWHVTPNICIVFLIYEHVTNWKAWKKDTDITS